MPSTLTLSDSDTLSTLNTDTASSSTVTVVSRNSLSGTAPSVPEPSLSRSLREESASTVVSSAPSGSGDAEKASVTDDASRGPRKGSSFWLSYAAVCICTFVSALDITSIPTSLPSIIESLSGGAASSWVGSSYTLASAALVPFTVVQGMGGGGMTGLSSIIVADLVPLAERGAYQGFKTMMWTCAAGVGPMLGGALSEKVSWRWLFYINLPASAFAFLFVLIFLRVRTPSGDVWTKLALVDWFGNFLLIASTILSNISLTWAGVRYAWADVRVLAPLISGLALMVAFVIYEKNVPTVPTMHWEVVTNRTALASLIATFFNGITSISIIYFLPIFFQAVFLASPLQSAIYSIPSALLISPFSFLNGLVVLKAKRYLPGNYVGWALIVAGSSSLPELVSSSRPSRSHSWRPSLSSASVLHWLSKPSSGRFLKPGGITISAAILQNTVKHRFPAVFIKELPSGSDFAFAALSRIAALPEPLQQEVKVAFGQGISAIYRVMIGVAGLGLLCVLFMKEVPMRGNVDKKFGLKEKKSSTGDGRDIEAGEKMHDVEPVQKS
ncbi:Efflux pump FUS6 [Mycena sanguinolenta]|uniref:Efflux pump FUS6 n=1 Tax=Mycena sanguinolenta TaxID=230812 RepID=A0A8H6ZE21_9AGAR|nr:Efflux pump FUS6 [Mycena sanguinolenta]